MTIKTAGDLRTFLADVLLDIRKGDVDVNKANAIAKIAAQINQSIATEVNTALQLKRMKQDQEEPGALLISGQIAPVWCEQCDRRVAADEVATCKSQFCKAKADA